MKWIFKACIYSLFAVLPPLTQANQVTARVITPVESVVPGETLWFGLSLEIADSWNTYWKNAGSTGLPPTLELSDGQIEIQPELLFPAAKTKPFGFQAFSQLVAIDMGFKRLSFPALRLAVICSGFKRIRCCGLLFAWVLSGFECFLCARACFLLLFTWVLRNRRF